MFKKLTFFGYKPVLRPLIKFIGLRKNYLTIGLINRAYFLHIPHEAGHSEYLQFINKI